MAAGTYPWQAARAQLPGRPALEGPQAQAAPPEQAARSAQAAQLQGSVGPGEPGGPDSPERPLDPSSVPAPLRPWVDWVLDGERLRCRLLHGTRLRRCVWPGQIDLDLDAQGGRFTQRVHADRRGLVPLPGDARLWPQDVQLDGKPAVVGGRDVPAVELPEPAGPEGRAGLHVITGTFHWDRLPDRLAVPAATGVVRLTLSGQGVDIPRRDQKGRLLLSPGTAVAGEKQSLEVVVHRKITDEIPLEVETRIKLEVAGSGREVTLGPALLPGFVPMSVKSDLPARLNPDGSLRVQVRPGQFTLRVVGRAVPPAGTGAKPPEEHRLSLPRPVGPWPAEEVWVLEPRPALRLAEVLGVSAVDPQQTMLPPSWKQLFSYRVRAGDTLRLKQRRRGTAGAAPDQLHLAREMWLDFDGRGLTFSDRLSGVLRHSSRLEVDPAVELGRVAVGDRDQVITRHAGRVGVELRQGAVDVQAEGRYRGDVGRIPAVGWRHDLQSLSTTLHLPPGWRLLAASGADRTTESWTGEWTLLDMFAVLIVALALARLCDKRLGVLALIVLVLTFTERDAPRWVWFVVIALEALRRVLPRGWLRNVTRLAHLGALLVLLVGSALFALRQLRQGLYPTLERPGRSVLSGPTYSRRRGVLVQLPQGGAAEPRPKLTLSLDDVPKEQPPARSPVTSSLSGSLGEKRPPKKRLELQLAEYDTQAVIQTGPGVPGWRWRKVQLSWNGPVQKDEHVRLYLLSPAHNLVLALLRTLGLAALLLGFLITCHRRTPWLDGADAWPPGGGPSWAGARAGLVAIGLAVLLLPARARADVPPEKLLEELRARLRRPPACAPHCATAPRMLVETSPRLLTIRLEVHALAPTAVPLPAHPAHWQPAQVVVDGDPASALAWQDDQLWLALPAGRHQITLSGALPDASVVQLSLPLLPRRVTLQAAGEPAWRVDGIHENGVPDATLTLSRVASGTPPPGAPRALASEALPPFVRVHRRLILGLSWEVETTVTRLTPTGAPVVLAIPLIPGESVTSESLRVRDGHVQVNMSPLQKEVSWRSALRPTERLRLVAAERADWSEAWQLVAGPIWHVDRRGFAPIHAEASGARTPTWRPWPGEALELVITRPTGVGGPTSTIDRAQLTLAPGHRATDVTLELTVRSSRGGQQVLTLPEGARLQQARTGATELPLRQEGRRVTVPISPGSQHIQLQWRQAGVLASRYVTPEVRLGGAAVNASITVKVPRSRWVLLTGGVRVGPAVLFWSLLAVLVLIALGVSRTGLSPLRTRHWLLLLVGLSQVPIWAALIVVGWLLCLGWRERTPDWGGRLLFNARQVALGLWTLPAAIVLFLSVHQGLLGQPDMQIRGNASDGYVLHWFADRVADALPQPWMLSLPLWVYRVAMLAWSLWLAWALIGWIRWAWRAYAGGAIWQRRPPRHEPPPPASPAPAEAPADAT